MFTDSVRLHHLTNILPSLEQGEFKLRVRSLEVERQNTRSNLVLKNIFSAVLATLLLQTGVIFSTVGKNLAYSTPVARGFFAVAAIMGIRVPYGVVQVNKLDEYNSRFGVKS